jgi:hypothetical protein
VIRHALAANLLRAVPCTDGAAQCRRCR